ncbi:hypothetical protein LOK49_LG05G01477 [Camellia lanceoleosa]|uniref:Uncharacterized protein n=1 Tax=Camellia lanceoleosa TaxID=1840588 RepID=A0ACC0HQU1_9ERIC|nr:hypothetical protein LOK49_LG05G01477 [Camellia lanceoleosa]
MNAVSNDSANDFIQDNSEGSDSDTDINTNTDDSPQFYQPISDVSDPANSDGDSDADSIFPHLANGYANSIENGISSIDLSDDEDTKSNAEDDDDERMREVTDSAIQRAFREDESRRNAPLTAETATRVMEAMRGVSFGGFAPDWANRVPEDQWINQIRRLRPPETTIHQN